MTKSGNIEPFTPPAYTILWSTQGGRAKACARRTARIVRDTLRRLARVTANISNNSKSLYDDGLCDSYSGCSFDEFGASNFLSLGSGGSDSGMEARMGRNSGTTMKGTSREMDKMLVILFVSTTGDGEHCDSIRETWRVLLQKSLPKNQFHSLQFALFSLGDRAYGPTAFCAAGRKLATRLVQLGAAPYCNIGYGDDGTPNGGVFSDLDVWLEMELLPRLLGGRDISMISSNGFLKDENDDDSFPISPYRVVISNESGVRAYSSNRVEEWQKHPYRKSYDAFFSSFCPATAYRYDPSSGARISQPNSRGHAKFSPLVGHVTSNTRITDKQWTQDTRHISIGISSKTNNTTDYNKTKHENDKHPNNTTANNTHLDTTPLFYQAGDIATILPSNPPSTVTKFLSVLPASIQAMVDKPLEITTTISASTPYANSYTPWPTRGTLRGILTHCADISSLPEREDLRSLSVYCNTHHPMGVEQKQKLVELSETSSGGGGAALFGDYVIREKRDWGDVLFDFDSIRYSEANGNGGGSGGGSGASVGFVPLTVEHLLMILPPIMPRHFSIASAPSTSTVLKEKNRNQKVRGEFNLDLCVAVVQQKTRRGRKYTGLCSGYLSKLEPANSPMVRIWIRPGSFSRLPLQLRSNNGGETTMEQPQSMACGKHLEFETPVMYIGAGTGIAPLRSLIQEREAVRTLALSINSDGDSNGDGDGSLNEVLGAGVPSVSGADNILTFGCRKSSADYYYKQEWDDLKMTGRLRLITAFSQEQKHKFYVQQAIREADGGLLIAKHILEHNGAVYIAGGAKMARAVKDEIIECLSKILPGKEPAGKLLLKKLQKAGKFSVEAWS